MNEYLESLVTSLENDGVERPSNKVNKDNTTNSNIDDYELAIIDRLEKANGHVFSDEQRKILMHRGNAVILACAGSGKTSISVNLIAKRIMSGEIRDTNKLIYTTFSKAGALEMEERMNRLMNNLGYGHIKVKVRTLHSFFLQVLRTFGVSSEIISNAERLRLIRRACNEAEYILKDDDLGIIDNLISFQINNLLSDDKAFNSIANSADRLELDQYVKIRTNYAKYKAEINKIDYDDMQYYLWMWLVKYAKSDVEQYRSTADSVRNYCKAIYDDFFIDEAQDVSKIQFAIIRAMISDPNTGKLDKGLVFIGDDDQCLVEGTKVLVDSAATSKDDTSELTETTIENVKPNMRVLSAVGHNKSELIKINTTHRSHHNGELVSITTSSGKNIKCTTNHLNFAGTLSNRVDKPADKWALMLFVGMETLVLNTTKVERIISAFYSDKHARAYVLNTYDTEAEAKADMKKTSLKFGVPDCGIKKVIREMESDEEIRKIYTDNYVKLYQILHYFDIDARYPILVNYRLEDLTTVTLTLGYGNEQSEITKTYQACLCVSTDNPEAIEIAEAYTKQTVYDEKNRKSRAVTTSRDVLTLEENYTNIIRKLASSDIKHAAHTVFKAYDDNETFSLMPAKNIKVGMTVAVLDDDGNITTEVITDVHRENYTGNVYDLSVLKSRNFFANDILTHNCIYTWRGSDPNIILTISTTFNMPTFVLSTNYRCMKEIVDFAASGIECNESRYKKSMQAFMDGGKVSIATSKAGDLNKLSEIALGHIKKLMSEGVKESDIAVLSRNNFHLSILGNMLLREGIYVKSTEDMKLTTNYMYKDIKQLLKLCENGYDHKNTEDVIWKVCKFIGIKNSNLLGKVQDTLCCKTSDAIGYVLKHYCGMKEIEVSIKGNLGPQLDSKYNYFFSRLSREVVETLAFIYRALISESDTENVDTETMRFITLATFYLSANEFRYKSKDKSRSIKGLLNYMSVLLKRDGYQKTLEFLRMTEQLEHGSMCIPGGKVELTTTHSAKGREWKHVIMFGTDNITQPSFDGIANLQMNSDTGTVYDYINEERRIFYVGSTRAKESLLFIYEETNPSIFLLEALKVASVGENNLRILRCIEDEQWFENFKASMDEIVNSEDSKYYYKRN